MAGPDAASKARALRALHRRGDPLLLPNAWDAASARAVAGSGFPAVASTSGGVAASLGWPDREQVPADEMFAALRRMAAVLEVPLSADIEAGYGLPAGELVDRLLDAGAVGCNLEDTDHRTGDGLVPPDEQSRRLAAVRDAAGAAGVDLVLNARIDVFLLEAGPPEWRVAEALERARLYLEAGADCVYPIVADPDSLAVFTAAIPGPVNAMALPGGPTLDALAGWGVARVSFGSVFARLAMSDFERRLAFVAGRGYWSS